MSYSPNRSTCVSFVRRLIVSWRKSLSGWHKTFCEKGMRVLIADDQRGVGLALADMVRCCGHQVVAVVGSGLEAINAYTLHKPDLVLMDYRMPKFNGGTACRHIIAKDPVARIILLSAWSPLDAADQSGALT